MLYEDLHSRYGTHIANRVSAELSPSEFIHVKIGELLSFLELRAERAHKAYQLHLGNSLMYEDIKRFVRVDINALHNHWRDAEDLAYLIAVAEDVVGNLRKIGF